MMEHKNLFGKNMCNVEIRLVPSQWRLVSLFQKLVLLNVHSFAPG